MAPARRRKAARAPDQSPASESDGRSRERRGSHVPDDSPPMPRRLSMSAPFSPGGPLEHSGRRRRASTFSAYSVISEANKAFQEEILHPGPDSLDTSTWRSRLPIMFALLPPLVGLVFQNGAAFCNDLILLGLAGVFLHWSTITPWNWYYAAQRVRVDQDSALEEALDIGSDGAPSGSSEAGSSEPAAPSAEEKHKQTRLMRAAQDRLRRLEMMALAGCFLTPALATYFLYFVRDYLNWSSKGVFSDLNLGIVLLATEVAPVSHAIRLVMAHTLHLQRTANTNPYKMVRITPSRYNALLSRIDDLEALVLARPAAEGTKGTASCPCSDPEHQQATAKQLREEVARDVRAAVQPDIDAVIRAVRRYEKKSSTLTQDTDQQMAELRSRLDDAIALSAVVARNSARRDALPAKVVRYALYLLTRPVAGTLWLASLLVLSLAAPLDWLARSGRRLAAGADTQRLGAQQHAQPQIPARQKRLSSSARSARTA